MYQNSRVYTPQISRQAAFVLRSIAWGLGTPMTKALDHAILALVPKLNHVVVCTTLVGFQVVFLVFFSGQGII